MFLITRINKWKKEENQSIKTIRGEVFRKINKNLKEEEEELMD